MRQRFQNLVRLLFPKWDIITVADMPNAPVRSGVDRRTQKRDAADRRGFPGLTGEELKARLAEIMQ